ncbi:unnamed protein product [Lactuca saligna]|uniref:TIR domain-containing protein n=1 Tax=Lactuca saligna TaxID=75948 RepID=A0AA35ZI94_LACSI|nr:unnamed protein product [Lactuca saligna]
MASSSSSSSMASTSPHGSYDVFLSFRGEDTRDSFTDHLYHALNRAGINTFRDNEEIDRGEKLNPEIGRAVKESRASIVVLSPNYATSTWCLDELLSILKQRKESNHFVLPVFYHVDPSDVRKHNKTFAIQVKANQRWTDHNVDQWKRALREVADLAGMVLLGPETEFIKEIVDTIYNKLDRKEVHLPLNLTGLATRYEDINSWLNRSNAEFLAICGMGGSGKTTLAKYIYDSNRKNFESMSFVEDISRRCKESDDLLQLQEQLLNDILGGKKRKIPGVSQATCKIEEALQTKKTLIVLDDVARRSELIALLGTGKINTQSKIIITTTTENTDNWFKFPYRRCQVYKMKLLDDDESLELLSRHAFGCKVPMEGFEELALQAVRYCEGNPLALVMLASSLSDDNTILYWKSRLNFLDKDFDSRIQSVLITSYESLPSILEKELFLHIACFFVGKDEDYVVKILEHDYCALSEMGKHIVRQESSKFPTKRSRVWLSSDSYKILSKGEGSETMEGLAMDMPMLRAEKIAFKSSILKTDALKKMDKLKLLQLNFVQLTGSYENFSEDLRWLSWLGFHLRIIPSELFMGNLVAIDMSYSNLEVFEPPMVLQSLQILNLKDSHNLFEIRNMWCANLCKREQTNLLVGLEASSSLQPTFSFPLSLHRLYQTGASSQT